MGKRRKARIDTNNLSIIEDDLCSARRKGWAEMIKKVYEIDPLLCPKCSGQMKIIAFITDYSVVDRIINHLKLSFIAERPPPSLSQHLLYEVAEERSEYFL